MRPTLRVTGAQRGSVIRGTATAGAEIDAVNLSASAADSTGFHETVTIARTDERGRFLGRLPMREGDVIRVRARTRQGLGRWVVLRARGIGGARRPVRVAIFRIGLRDLGNGKVRLLNLSPARPIAAPGERFCIHNPRTRDRVRVVINDKGTFAGTPTVAASAGDVLRVLSSPERGGRARLLGTLTTPSPLAPIPPARRGRLASERVTTYAYHQRVGFVPSLARADAPLFDEQPRAADVFQSELPNCHVASASAAVAHVRPASITRAIATLGGGRYRVRFRASDGRGGTTRVRDVVVTSDLYVRPSGELLYGASSGEARARVLWWPLLEKAFARLKGGYRNIGQGGCADIVMRALVGRPARRFFVDAAKEGEAARVWAELVRAFSSRLPVCAGTSSYSPRRYRNTGLVPDHAYTVLSCRETKRARFVSVRNPWGEDAVAPCRPRRNGVLELELEEFVRLFTVISTVR